MNIVIEDCISYPRPEVKSMLIPARKRLVEATDDSAYLKVIQESIRCLEAASAGPKDDIVVC